MSSTTGGGPLRNGSPDNGTEGLFGWWRKILAWARQQRQASDISSAVARIVCLGDNCLGGLPSKQTWKSSLAAAACIARFDVQGLFFSPIAKHEHLNIFVLSNTKKSRSYFN
jgi:hypothetical protein